METTEASRKRPSNSLLDFEAFNETDETLPEKTVKKTRTSDSVDMTEFEALREENRILRERSDAVIRELEASKRLNLELEASKRRTSYRNLKLRESNRKLKKKQLGLSGN